MMTLIHQTARLKDSYLRGLKELQDSGICLNYSYELAQVDFEAVLQQMYDYDDESKIPEEHVPCLRMWLVEDETFVGNVTIRRWLNEQVMDKGHIGMR